jgi:D-beta-D-heptose 7-phosphate kinase/D-beta-D-heptose 1-phosphate adenosyltransferase
MTETNIAIKETAFGRESNFNKRYISDFNKLKDTVKHLKGLGLKVVLTQGTYDMVHIGHARYFEEAKKHGDILVIGVDSDEKVRSRKGPERPVVPQEERLEMVAHMRSVDIVVLKEYKHPKWHLIKTVMPDVLIATKETYNNKQLKELKKFCGQVMVLDPQATTSTSAKIRKLQISTAKSLGQALTPKIMSIIEEVLGDIKDIKGKTK